MGRNRGEKDNNKGRGIKSFSNLMGFAKSNWLLLILMLAFTLAIYANIITGDFVNLDDLSKSLVMPQFQDIMLSIKLLDGHGILTTTIYKAFGVNSSAFHVASIISHMVNGILVFLFLYILFGKKVATISTFLFLSHPANTEAVSWHAGQIYVLRANIILPILIFFALYKKAKNIKYLIISTGIFLFGMIFFKSQGWMFITPFLVVLMDQFIFEDKIRFKNILSYLPILIISLIFAVTLLPGFFKERVVGLKTLYYVDTETATPLINRVPYTIYMEYKTLFYPKELSIYHEGKFISNFEYAFMVLVTAGVILGIVYFWKNNRKISGLLLMIIFSILPSFSPVIIAWIAAERYLYMPSIFSSAIIAIFLIWIEERINRKSSKSRNGKTVKFVLYSTIIIVGLYSIRTVIRNNDLRNSKNLWIATKKTAPYSYRVYNNMGDVLAGEGDFEGAIENFKISVALKPDYADAVHNIGHIYLELKDYERAKKYLSQSFEMNPRLYPAAYKLGIIAYEERDYEKAREYFSKCLDVDPTSQDCLNGINAVSNR